MIATEVPGEAVAAILTVMTVMGVGLTSWMLMTMVKLTGIIAGLEAKLEEHERVLARHEQFISAGHPEHRP